ncbi:MAG: hypothetical protein AAFN10_21035 [Bacteroidota bacterium]
MRVFLVGLIIGLSSLSLSAQENDFYQKGESLISIRNAKFGIQGSRNEWPAISGLNLDYGYFFKDRWLIGGGVQGYFTDVDGADNNSYYVGLQLFSRYYFKPFGKKDQFILFAEPRLEARRSFFQTVGSNGEFDPSSNFLFVGAGFHAAWRPLKRLSFDLGVQPQFGWGRSIGSGQEPIYTLNFNFWGNWALNYHF